MLKKLLLIFLSANLYATEQTKNNNELKTTIAVGAIGFGIAAIAAYSSNSALLELASKLNGEEARKLLLLGRAGIALAGAALGFFTVNRLYPIGKEMTE